MEYLGLVALLLVFVLVFEVRHLRSRCSTIERDHQALFERLAALEREAVESGG